VRYATPTSFRTALEQRLKSEHQRAGVSLVRLRKAVAFDRLLARLLEVAPERWVLKGAVALDLRLGLPTRMTKDIDLGRRDSEEAATEDFIAAQGVDLNDFFTFEIERTPAFDRTAEFSTVRYSVRCLLAGRLWEEFPLDVAFSDPLGWEPDRLQGTDLLEFAGISPIEVPAAPLPQHVAEKLHAYTGVYGGTERGSTRVKDLIDLVLVRFGSRPRSPEVAEALRRTFDARGRQPLPTALPPPPPEWKTPYAKLARAVGLDEDLAAGHAAAAALLNPVLAGDSAGEWDPEHGSWVETPDDGGNGGLQAS
jgi:hypothetical protein